MDRKQGVRWQPVDGRPNAQPRADPIRSSSAAGSANAERALSPRKARVRNPLRNAEVSALKIDNGPVFSRRPQAQGPDGRAKVSAATLVAAAGGFEAQLFEWLKQ